MQPSKMSQASGDSSTESSCQKSRLPTDTHRRHHQERERERDGSLAQDRQHNKGWATNTQQDLCDKVGHKQPTPKNVKATRGKLTHFAKKLQLVVDAYFQVLAQINLIKIFGLHSDLKQHKQIQA
jgi:hypothetical protein